MLPLCGEIKIIIEKSTRRVRFDGNVVKLNFSVAPIPASGGEKRSYTLYHMICN